MACRVAADRKVNVLLESACRHDGDAEELVSVFVGAGYVVDVVVLGVPAALSRLGLVVRYLEYVGDGDGGGTGRRLTPGRVHEESFDGVLKVARALDGGGLEGVAGVLVVRRNGILGEVGVGGVEGAVVRERGRPLAREEFDAAMRDLRACEASREARVVELLPEIQSLLEELGVGDGHVDGMGRLEIGTAAGEGERRKGAILFLDNQE